MMQEEEEEQQKDTASIQRPEEQEEDQGHQRQQHQQHPILVTAVPPPCETWSNNRDGHGDQFDPTDALYAVLLGDLEALGFWENMWPSSGGQEHQQQDTDESLFTTTTNSESDATPSLVTPVMTTRCVSSQEAWIVLLHQYPPFVVVPQSSPALRFLYDCTQMETVPLDHDIPVTTTSSSSGCNQQAPSPPPLRFSDFLRVREVPFCLHNPQDFLYQYNEAIDTISTQLVCEPVDDDADAHDETSSSPSTNNKDKDKDLEKNEVATKPVTLLDYKGFQFVKSGKVLAITWVRESTKLPLSSQAPEAASNNNGTPVVYEIDRTPTAEIRDQEAEIEDNQLLAQMAEEDDYNCFTPYADLNAEWGRGSGTADKSVYGDSEGDTTDADGKPIPPPNIGTKMAGMFRSFMHNLGFMEPPLPSVLPTTQGQRSDGPRDDSNVSSESPVPALASPQKQSQPRVSFQEPVETNGNDDKPDGDEEEEEESDPHPLEDISSFPLLQGRWCRMSLQEYRTWLCVSRRWTSHAALVNHLWRMARKQTTISPLVRPIVETPQEALHLLFLLQQNLSTSRDYETCTGGRYMNHKVTDDMLHPLFLLARAQDGLLAAVRQLVAKSPEEEPGSQQQLLLLVKQHLDQYDKAAKRCFSSPPSQPTSPRDRENS